MFELVHIKRAERERETYSTLFLRQTGRAFHLSKCRLHLTINVMYR